MAVINVLSLNVRGIREAEKRREIFHYYRDRCDILCLQETHSDEASANIWRNEWGGEILFSHGTTQARGVAILFKKSSSLCVKEKGSDTDGRFAYCVVQDNSTNICIATVYSPNRDSPSFFTENLNICLKMSDKVMVTGDFNTVLDPSVDKSNADGTYNKQASEKIKQLMDEMYLEDIWRVHNPGVKRYSWYRKRPRQYSRIDFTLVSKGLSDMVHDVYYITGIRSDHSAVFTGLQLSNNERGPGYWKFNSSKLADIEFVRKVNEELLRIKRDTVAYGPVERWEKLKSDIKKYIVVLSRRAASEDQLAISQLSEYVTDTEAIIGDLDDHQVDLLTQSKSELEELLAKKTRGIMFRSKAKWQMEGERNSKYFFSLEKARYGAKTRTCIFNKSDQLISTPREVLNVQHEFYQELYTADHNVHFTLEDEVDNKVKQSSLGASEDQFTEIEFSEALKSLRNGSCPGSDGLSTEFFKCFWVHLKEIYTEAMHEAYSRKLMNKSARQGVLNLIPKGNKDSRFLKNLRPITLLNTDYKIVEKAIANRMMPDLEEVIHQDQRGFLPNRRIASNIRKLLDIMNAAETEKKEIMVMSCDYLKCFDRVETECVIKSMEYFGFSNMLQEWVKTVYSGFSIKIQNNGVFSTPVSVTRSLHQGGPASNPLFLVVAELLAISLRKDGDIKGAFVKEILHLLNQYADDMDVCMMFDQRTLDLVLKHIQRFGESTGFKLSYDKTSLYRVGSLRNSKAELYTAEGLKWCSETINVLGVDIYHDPSKQAEANYEAVINKAKRTVDSWGVRNLSLLGKIQVVETLISSLFVYKMTVLPKMHDSDVKRLNKIVEEFIWNNHKPKIRLSQLQNAKDEGGQKLVNFSVKDKSLKASWVRMIMDGSYPAEFANSFLCPVLGNLVWCCNLKCEDVNKVISMENPFWVDVLTAWCEYHYPSRDGPDHMIWLNSDIRIDDRPVCYRRAVRRGLLHVSQLFENGRAVEVDVLCKKYNLTPMEANSLLAATPKWMKQTAQNAGEVFVDRKFAEYMHAESPAKCVYDAILPVDNYVDVVEGRWRSELQEEIDLREAISAIKFITLVTKYRSYQYRFLMRALVTNVHLKHWKKRECDSCSFCHVDRELYKHLFFSCVEVQVIWNKVREISEKLGLGPPSLSYRDVVLCGSSNNMGINFIIVIAKQYIYRQRCLNKSLNIREFEGIVFENKNVEKYYAVKCNRLAKYYNKWNESQIVNNNCGIFSQIENVGEL